MAIQKQFVIRYRVDGHLRFQVPEQLADPAVAAKVVEKITAIKGVYRARVFCKDRKLSIRYQESVCDFIRLCQQIFLQLDELDKQGWFEKQSAHDSGSASIKQKLKNSKVSRWFREKYAETKETLLAAKVIGKLGMKRPNALIKDPEKAIIDFFNDVLVLYLIKLHWSRITQEWIPRPFAHRYEWTAVLYMFYLLIRSRRPKK